MKFVGKNLQFLQLLYVLICESFGFNFDLNFAVVIRSAAADDYFGYSVLLQKGQFGRILVGAPKANSSLSTLLQINKPGSLYQCDVDYKTSCKPFVIDPNGNVPVRDYDKKYEYRSKRDGSMLGASIDGGEIVEDPVIVCSPKWINDRYDKNGEHYLLNGICYQIENSEQLNDTSKKLMPLLNADHQGYVLNGIVKYFYANGQTGMSVKYLKNEKQLLLGAPGVLSWKGTVIKYESHSLPPLQKYTNLRNKRQIYSHNIIPNPVYFKSIKQENSYFGYSLSYGYFTNKKNYLWYISGAPRAENLYGLVLLYTYDIYDDTDLRVHKTFIGDQFGAYYGASVLGIDVSGDGISDLIIGAPSYVIDKWDEGCVYFYKNDGQGNFDSPLQIFGSKYPGAKFGLTISDIGDINNDLYQDIAIAAPYEENGVIYIFLGSKNGLNTQYSQKISAKQIDKTIKGFGFSISKGIDIDNNFYNDIAVGAYKSGHVTLIKSRPVIHYVAELFYNSEKLTIETINITITYCITYTSKKNNVKHVSTYIKMIRDFGIKNDHFLETINLKQNEKTCKNVNFTNDYTLSDSLSKPIEVELIYTIENNHLKEFCSLCPITNPLDSNSIALTIPFENGCGTDNICQPDLVITAFFSSSQHITVGLTNNITVIVFIENYGEPAYLPQIFIKIPEDIDISRILSNCQLNEERIYSCLVDNVLKKFTKKMFVFNMNLKKINPHNSHLSLNFSIESNGDEKNFTNNYVNISLPIILQNDVVVIRKSTPEQILIEDNYQAQQTKLLIFTHEFLVTNFGPSPLLSTQLILNIPSKFNTLSKIFSLNNYKIDIFINNQPISCSNDNDLNVDTEKSLQTASLRRYKNVISNEKHKRSFLSSTEESSTVNEINNLPFDRIVFVNCSTTGVTCKTHFCNLDKQIIRSNSLGIKIFLNATVERLNDIELKKDLLLVTTSIDYKTAQKSFHKDTSTLLIQTKKAEKVSYWIYIICVLTALAVLAIIILILYKFKFFSRPTHDKLHNKLEEMTETSSINGRNTMRNDNI